MIKFILFFLLSISIYAQNIEIRIKTDSIFLSQEKIEYQITNKENYNVFLIANTLRGYDEMFNYQCNQNHNYILFDNLINTYLVFQYVDAKDSIHLNNYLYPKDVSYNKKYRRTIKKNKRKTRKMYKEALKIYPNTNKEDFFKDYACHCNIIELKANSSYTYKVDIPYMEEYHYEYDNFEKKDDYFIRLAYKYENYFKTEFFKDLYKCKKMIDKNIFSNKVPLIDY